LSTPPLKAGLRAAERVKFSKPVAYQEVEGKRRYVEASYQVEANEYWFKLGEYEKDRELVIDPVLQSTYLGGSGGEEAYSIAIGSGGNVYVAGYTYSVNFPGTTGGAQPTKGAGQDVFVAKLNPALTTLVQSTYLGGSGYDYVNSIAIGSGGNVYVAGYTNSTDFPGTIGSPQPTKGAGQDAFVTKLNPALTDLVQSTYLGDSNYDDASSLAIGSEGNVYVAGRTDSTDFPGTAGGAQPSFGGFEDAFVAKFNPALTELIQSTYLGGSGGDPARSIAIGSDGNIYVAGGTTSTNFPGTAEGAQPNKGAGEDVFVARLNPSLTALVRSTYLGGSGTDSARSIAIDSAGNVYVAGGTQSADFPGTEEGAQDSFGGGSGDAFVARLNPALTDLVQSTYLGGSGYEGTALIAISSGGGVYAAGYTTSTDFPGTTGGAQPFGGFDYDAFVARLNPGLTKILQSTYLGGSGGDPARSIAIGSEGNVYVAGFTDSTNFPGRGGGAQPSYGGGGDAFVARLYPELTEPPGAATLVSPAGTIDTKTPTYKWNAVARAAEYDLRVNDSTGNKILQWYSASEAGCASGEATCEVTPPTALAVGPGKWWIQARNSAGIGPLSSGKSFTVEAVSAPGIPYGPRNGEANTTYYYAVRATSNGGDPIEYLFNWGDGTNSGWVSGGVAAHAWAIASTYLVTAQARCQIHPSVISSSSKALSVAIENTISTPTPPSGPTSGTAGVSYVYSTGGSTSEPGHSIQYLFDWGDGTNSGWLPVGKTSASKSWASLGTYIVRAKARCSTHNLAISDWSAPLGVSIQKLTVITPNGGEVIPSGRPYTIQWTAPSLGEVKYKILYSMDNGATWKLIASDVIGTSYNWDPVPVPPGNRTSCYVKVIGYNANVKVGEDRSDKPFAIGVVKLLTPNGGEVLGSGDPYLIQWQINGTKSPVTKVNLYYTTNGGASYALIESIPKADPGTRPWADSHPWTVPTPPGNRANCYVKVVAYSGSTVVGSDRSDKPFTIAGVNLLQPNGGEVLGSGDPYTIQWEINGTKSDVTKVNLYSTTNGGASYALIESIPKTDPGTRPWVDSHPWTVPVPASNKNNCYVKVVAYSGSTVVGSDRSDKPFTIAVVKLGTPNGGEVFWSGNKYDIQWEIYGTKSPVTTQKLYYSTNAGATWSLITTLDGSLRGYPWMLPLVQTTKTKCKVKVVITDTKGVTSSDVSDGYFTLQP
jgi:hypothetical protein